MKTFKCSLIAFALIAVLSPAAFAEADDPAQNGGDARLLGMGEAYTAVCDDTNAIFVNPAGLATLKKFEMTGMYYTRVFNTYYYLTAAGAMPTPYGNIGIGYVGSGIGDIIETEDASDTDYDTFGYYDNVIMASYGTSLGQFDENYRRVFVGTSAKLFFRGFADSVTNSGFGINFDVGLKYVPSNWYSFGIAKSNILPGFLGGGIMWDTGRTEQLTSPTRLGVSIHPEESEYIGSFDVVLPSDPRRPVLYNLGGEFKLEDRIVVRAGFAGNVDAKSSSRLSLDPSLGIGFTYENFMLNYAFRPYFADSAHPTHYISIGFDGDIGKIIRIESETEKEPVSGLYKGDVLPIKVRVPYDIESVVTVMPDGREIELTYDTVDKTWFGSWKVGGDIAAGLHEVRVIATDYEGNKIVTNTKPIYIDSSRASGGLVLRNTPGGSSWEKPYLNYLF